MSVADPNDIPDQEFVGTRLERHPSSDRVVVVKVPVKVRIPVKGLRRKLKLIWLVLTDNFWYSSTVSTNLTFKYPFELHDNSITFLTPRR